jgi:mono/diheme cytochrome c family protein
MAGAPEGREVTGERWRRPAERLLAAALVLCAAGVARAAPEEGARVFERHCSHCHAPGVEHPGTAQLTRRRGAQDALLQGREDLPEVYIRHVVRNGRNAMPSFLPTALTEEELDALTGYLTR